VRRVAAVAVAVVVVVAVAVAVAVSAAVGALATVPVSATDAFPAASRAASPPPPPPPPGSVQAARLQGVFRLGGRITVAIRVPGERVGQPVLRTWTLIPACPAGPCPVIGLVRQRPTGRDRLRLRRLAPALYVGSGSFLAPLRCGSRTYPRGAAVPYTIAVRITATAISGGVTLATGIHATYTNRVRINLTRCVSVLGHDAATYRGALMRL
jgi:hypothetical protein